MINEPPPLNGDYNKDPNINALKRKGFINQRSALDNIIHFEIFLSTGSN